MITTKILLALKFVVHLTKSMKNESTTKGLRISQYLNTYGLG